MTKIGELDRGIGNIVDVIVNTGSRALTEKLRELEAQKAALDIRLSEINAGLPEFQASPARVAAAFRKGKQMLKNGNIKSRQAIIQQYVDRIIVNREDILCSFMPLPQMNKTVPFSREALRAL